MKIYTVSNGKDYNKTFYRISDAKKAMKAHNAKGSITYVNNRTGEWEPLGPIELGGNNATFVANTRSKKAGY